MFIFPVLLKILYLDDSFLGLYLCDLERNNMDPNEGCISSSVRVMMFSHNEDESTPERYVILYRIASESCQQSGDFMEISPNCMYYPIS